MTEGIRLNKRMAELGLCSRREADDWIDRGWVLVNGAPAVMGVKVLPSDKIDVDKRATGAQAQQVTVLLLCQRPGRGWLRACHRAGEPAFSLDWRHDQDSFSR
jgi:16S rRNA U516 pseudouridylate synthase RsuA-like enzyme